MPFSGSPPACAAPTGDLDPVQRRALAAGLQRPAGSGALEHEAGGAAAGLVLDQRPRCRRADLLVPGDQQAHPVDNDSPRSMQHRRAHGSPAPARPSCRPCRARGSLLRRSTTGALPVNPAARRCRDGPGSPPGSARARTASAGGCSPSTSIRSAAATRAAGRRSRRSGRRSAMHRGRSADGRLAPDERLRDRPADSGSRLANAVLRWLSH